MGKHAFLSVFFGALFILAAGIYVSTLQDPNQPHAGFPWQVDVSPSGHTRIFGLSLQQSSLHDAEKIFKEYAEITLFVPNDEAASIEAFFEDVKIAGLKSKIVLSMQVVEDDIQAMINRGARIATLGSGTRKITLSGEDAAKVRQSPIFSMTYLPSIHLNAELLEKRFGVPAEKINDPLSDAVHWLYPDKGVDVALSETAKEVIQYINPASFAALVQPLKAPESN